MGSPENPGTLHAGRKPSGSFPRDLRFLDLLVGVQDDGDQQVDQQHVHEHLSCPCPESGSVFGVDPGPHGSVEGVPYFELTPKEHGPVLERVKSKEEPTELSGESHITHLQTMPVSKATGKPEMWTGLTWFGRSLADWHACSRRESCMLRNRESPNVGVHGVNEIQFPQKPGQSAGVRSSFISVSFRYPTLRTYQTLRGPNTISRSSSREVRIRKGTNSFLQSILAGEPNLPTKKG